MGTSGLSRGLVGPGLAVWWCVGLKRDCVGDEAVSLCVGILLIAGGGWAVGNDDSVGGA